LAVQLAAVTVTSASGVRGASPDEPAVEPQVQATLTLGIDAGAASVGLGVSMGEVPETQDAERSPTRAVSPSMQFGGDDDAGQPGPRGLLPPSSPHGSGHRPRSHVSPMRSGRSSPHDNLGPLGTPAVQQAATVSQTPEEAYARSILEGGARMLRSGRRARDRAGPSTPSRSGMSTRGQRSDVLDKDECQFLLALADSFTMTMAELEGDPQVMNEDRNRELAKMRTERDSLQAAAELKDRQALSTAGRALAGAQVPYSPRFQAHTQEEVYTHFGAQVELSKSATELASNALSLSLQETDTPQLPPGLGIDLSVLGIGAGAAVAAGLGAPAVATTGVSAAGTSGTAPAVVAEAEETGSRTTKKRRAKRKEAQVAPPPATTSGGLPATSTAKKPHRKRKGEAPETESRGSRESSQAPTESATESTMDVETPSETRIAAPTGSRVEAPSDSAAEASVASSTAPEYGEAAARAKRTQKRDTETIAGGVAWYKGCKKA
ncbi:MAG: Uncharacterized protein FD187_3234, partial [bacterium]